MDRTWVVYNTTAVNGELHVSIEIQVNTGYNMKLAAVVSL
jgi:hypothetical protein